jgi:hypothetical protein
MHRKRAFLVSGQCNFSLPYVDSYNMFAPGRDLTKSCHCPAVERKLLYGLNLRSLVARPHFPNHHHPSLFHPCLRPHLRPDPDPDPDPSLYPQASLTPVAKEYIPLKVRRDEVVWWQSDR